MHFLLFDKGFCLVSNAVLLVKLNFYGIQVGSDLTDKRQEAEIKSYNVTQNSFSYWMPKG
jgi:hypothetical protein